MSGRNPISSIRSASSSTTWTMSPRYSVRRWMWSSTRPGVPTTRSTPFCRERICRSIGSPPNVPQTATGWPVGELLELDDDLLDQLAGRRQDDGLGPAAAGLEHLDQRDAERGGLARARLGLADDVEAVECLGDEGRLDGGGLGITGVLQSPQHRGAQVHGQEPGRGLLCQRVESINPPKLQSSVESPSGRPRDSRSRANLAWADNGNGSESLAASPFSGRSQSCPLGEPPLGDSIRLAGIGEGMGLPGSPSWCESRPAGLSSLIFGGDGST